MIYIYERDWLRKFAALFNLVIEEVEGVFRVAQLLELVREL